MRQTLYSWIANVLLTTIALLFVAELFDAIYISSIKVALIASIILSFMHLILRPVLIIISFPVILLTLGLFIVFINALLLMMTEKLLGASFVIDGFGVALVASIILSFITFFLNKIFHQS